MEPSSFISVGNDAGDSMMEDESEEMRGGGTNRDDNDGGEGGGDAVVASTTTTTRAWIKVLLPAPPRAVDLAHAEEPPKKLYWDRSHYDSPASQKQALRRSSTLYVGNLAFRTATRHIRAHFSQLGPVKALHMGLDRVKKTPCGFCFVEYLYRADALAAVSQLSGTKLDGKIIRVELDAGFQPGRQYGRGVSGGQVRDDRRNANDPARKRGRTTDSTYYGGNTSESASGTGSASGATGTDGGGASGTDVAGTGTTSEGRDGDNNEESMDIEQPASKRRRLDET